MRDLAFNLGLQLQALVHLQNPSPLHLVQLQLWTPQITKTRPLSSVTPVSNANSRLIPRCNPRSGPSKIPRSTLPPHSTKPYPLHTKCPQVIPIAHGPLALRETSRCHVARRSSMRRRLTPLATDGWHHPLTVLLNEPTENRCPNRPLD